MRQRCEHGYVIDPEDRCPECERDALRRDNERLRAALRPFADESIFSGPQHEYVTVKRSDCDIARAALEERT